MDYTVIVPFRDGQTTIEHLSGSLPPAQLVLVVDDLSERSHTAAPLISVIIPCHNYGRFLSDAVNSLLGGTTCLGEVPPQTLQAFEIIIVDDASDDETPAIGAALADPWRGVHYLRLDENRGTPGALNAGIAAAHGQYITVLSADDMMLPDRLERLYRAAEEHPDAVICDDLLALVDGKLGPRYHLPPYDADGLVNQNTMHAGILYRRAWWQEVGGYPEQMVNGREDWAMNVLLARCGHHGYMLDYAGYLYRRHGNNRSQRNQGANWRAFFREQIERILEDNMACCGQRRTTAPAQTPSARSNPALPGTDTGLVLLEYTGSNHALVSWWGPSGQRYDVSAAQRRLYVLPGDADFFLRQVEGGQPIFRAAQRPGDEAKPEQASTVDAQPVTTAKPENIDLSDGVDDAEATLAAQALAKRPRRRKPDRATADA